MPKNIQPHTEVASRIAEMTDTDVMLFNSQFSRPIDINIIRMLRARKRRKNALLLLVSTGGDADVAYRIARAFQSYYQQYTVFISGFCKSAGTLCALGAHEIVMSDFGELGPLDVQFQRKDELGELSSGLVVTEALDHLQAQAFGVFEQHMLNIKTHSFNQVSFKLAAELATKLTTGLFQHIYCQIDPVQIGELGRAMAIARDYGKRLGANSNNFTDDTLDLLAESYPSHGFVIDRREAEKIFNRVREPSEDEQALADSLGQLALMPGQASQIQYLSKESGDAQATTDENKPAQIGPASPKAAASPRTASKGRNGGNLGGAEAA